MAKKMNHVMIDIETLGKVPYCVILSIGAVEFDMNSSSTGKTFYKKISLDSMLKAGLLVDSSTILWWMGQSDEARKEFTGKSGYVSIQNALNEFTKYFKSLDKDVSVWANSPGFDCNHIQEAYELVLGGEAPWRYNQPRDCRTLFSIYPERAPVKSGIAHNALDDCMWQIENLRLAVKGLGLSGRFK